MSSLWLMYHDVVDGEPDPRVPPSAALYHVTAERFAAHLDAITASGLPATTAGAWRAGERSVVLTFDDGWLGSLRRGVEQLQHSGLVATFYILKDFIGRRGFADRQSLLDAHRAGMEIGVHGSSHRALSSCTEDEVRSELGDCKKELEDLLGAPVVSASAPGGEWNPGIARIAEELGLRTLSTSRPGLNRAGAPPRRLRRMAIRRQTSAAHVAKWCRFDVGAELWRWRLLQLPRTVLGPRLYTRLRRTLLRDRGHHDEIFKA
ncbi:MAG: polysaccharide deacetylase family protein [Acidobacteriota bacterium]